MERFYHHTTGTEAIKGLHEYPESEVTSIHDMPLEAREWFFRPAREGYEWKCLNGKWPEEVKIPDPSNEYLSLVETKWRNSELSLSDKCFSPDFGPNSWTDEQRKTAQDEIISHRAKLKDWDSDNPDFPDNSKRPVWPESVPRPVV